MSEKGNFDSTDVRIAQKNSKPDADTESRLARNEAAIQELRKRVEAATRAADSLEPGRKIMEELTEARMTLFIAQRFGGL